MTENNDDTKIVAPNAASQGMEGYLKARFSGLPSIVLEALGVGEPRSGAGGYIELALREEYWRLRCEALEGNLTKFVRAYIAAFNVIKQSKPDYKDEDIKDMVIKALDDVPDAIDKTPEL